MSNRIIKSISFNKSNQHDLDLLEFASDQDKYFGKYIKRLIERDKREKGKGFNHVPALAPSTQITQSNDEDGDAASAFL